MHSPFREAGLEAGARLNPNSEAGPRSVSGARPSGRFRTDRGGVVCTHGTLRPVKRRERRAPCGLALRPSYLYFGVRACAGEAGSHAGASPAGRVRLFTTESWVWEAAVRPNPKARPSLNRPVVTNVNLIQ